MDTPRVKAIPIPNRGGIWDLVVYECPFCGGCHHHGGGNEETPFSFYGGRLSHCVVSPRDYELEPLTNWGIWYISDDLPLSLNVGSSSSSRCTYFIELSRLNHTKKILHWINHFIASGKRFADKESIRHFMIACRTLQVASIMPKYKQGDKSDQNWGY